MRFEITVPDLSQWRQGNTGTSGVWHVDSGRPGRHVLLSCLVHGNELCGAWAIKGLLEAGLRPSQGKLTLIFANLAAFDSFNAEHHDASRFVEEDLNRQWSSDRIASGSSLERRRAAELAPWVAQADWLLDLHSMHESGAPLLLTGLQARNVALASALGASARVIIDGGHKDGLRMRDFGRFGQNGPEAAGTRSLLIECGFHGELASLAVARDIVFRFLKLSEVVSKTMLEQQLPSWLQADAAFAAPLKVTDAVVARSEAFRFTTPVANLQEFERAGTQIGDNDGEAVSTPYDHCILVMPSVRQAKKGVTVVRFAQAA